MNSIRSKIKDIDEDFMKHFEKKWDRMCNIKKIRFKRKLKEKFKLRKV